MAQLLEVKGVRKTTGAFELAPITFSQQRKQRIGIAGASGSGKSTLLRMIAGWIQPDEGSIWFDGKKVKGPEDQLIPGHPKIAYLSQHFELRNNYRMEELLAYANKLSEEQAQTLYEICRIDSFLGRKNDALSGGEKQRIALARLLVAAPELLLLDEPFSNLDRIHKQILKQVIESLSDSFGITCLLVSHDASDLLPWASELKIMEQGRLIQEGTPELVYTEPVNAYVAELLGPFNLLPASLLQLHADNQQAHFSRPEQWRIVQGGQRSLSGVVIGSYYYGADYLTELKVHEKTLHIRTGQFYSKGETLQVAYQGKKHWWL
jgi:ABC-type Fe3+/spermidine/putrescine transport system ATPase subunit